MVQLCVEKVVPLHKENYNNEIDNDLNFITWDLQALLYLFNDLKKCIC